MDYFTFKQTIIDTLKDSLGENISITVQDILKNNNTHLDGLTILPRECNLSPTIYLNHYYKQYQNGMVFSEIVSEILETYQQHQPLKNIDISFFTDYERIKSKIIFKLIHYEQNQNLLAHVPHFPFLDLALVFACLLHSNDTGNATILIHNHHLSFWHITKEELYTLAFLNTPRLLPPDLKNMDDVLKDLLPNFSSDVSSPEDSPISPLYVLTNRSKLNGASCIFYPDLLKNFADQMNSDLYILPSSIHEVLLLPADSEYTSMELSDIVTDVNHSQVSHEDILSNHVYYFSRETGKITL